MQLRALLEVSCGPLPALCRETQLRLRRGRRGSPIRALRWPDSSDSYAKRVASSASLSQPILASAAAATLLLLDATCANCPPALAAMEAAASPHSTAAITTSTAVVQSPVEYPPALSNREAPPLPPSASLPTLTLALTQEPANALSLPTWIIHVASVVEWVAAIFLVWEWGAAQHRSAWRGLSFAMLPLLIGAMCACTWHLFYNAPELEALVALQSFMTLVGNGAICVAAHRIFQQSRGELRE